MKENDDILGFHKTIVLPLKSALNIFLKVYPRAEILIPLLIVLNDLDRLISMMW